MEKKFLDMTTQEKLEYYQEQYELVEKWLSENWEMLPDYIRQTIVSGQIETKGKIKFIKKRL